MSRQECHIEKIYVCVLITGGREVGEGRGRTRATCVCVQAQGYVWFFLVAVALTLSVFGDHRSRSTDFSLFRRVCANLNRMLLTIVFLPFNHSISISLFLYSFPVWVFVSRFRASFPSSRVVLPDVLRLTLLFRYLILASVSSLSAHTHARHRDMKYIRTRCASIQACDVSLVHPKIIRVHHPRISPSHRRERTSGRVCTSNREVMERNRVYMYIIRKIRPQSWSARTVISARVAGAQISKVDRIARWSFEEGFFSRVVSVALI